MNLKFKIEREYFMDSQVNKTPVSDAEMLARYECAQTIFRGEQSTLPAVPQTRLHTATTTVYQTFPNFCKNHLASSPQPDFEQTVEQHIALMRVEVTRGQFIAPAWEACLDMVARKEGIESQVTGLTGICVAA